MGKEVLPAIRDYATELGLKDLFETNAPLSLNEELLEVAQTILHKNCARAPSGIDP